MVKLVETNNLQKTRLMQLNARESFYEVPAIGDGNCALNAFALGLIDLVKRDANAISNDTLKKFIDRIRSQPSLLVLQERLALYQQELLDPLGNEYTDLAAPLKKFIEFIMSNPSVAAFKNYIIQQNTREQIAALHVAFAPALRSIGVDAYIEKLREMNVPSELADAEDLRSDGVMAGRELIAHLAKDFFHINVRIQDQKAGETSETDRISGAAEFSLLHLPGHWNYLLPIEQQNGLGAELKEPNLAHPLSDVEKRIDENETLLLVEREFTQQLQKKKGITKGELDEVAAVMQTASENLIELSKSASAESFVDNQATVLALDSHEILKKLRKQLNLANDGLSELLSEEKKRLVRGPEQDESLPANASTDEKLARSLQNAEILAFLNDRYKTLTPTQPLAPRKTSVQGAEVPAVTRPSI